MPLSDIVLALIPVAVLLGIGFAFRRTGFLTSDDFWSGSERLAYFVLLPTLLFSNVATVDLDAFRIGPLAGALIGSTVVVSLLMILLRRFVAVDSAAFTSVFQGGIRFNTYIGLSLAGSLFGAEGLALAAIIGAFLVPLVNVASALVFEFLLVDSRSWLSLARSVVLNPLVLGCVIGIVWNVAGLGMPDLLADIVDPFAAAALPIGLLCVGAGIRRISIGSHAPALIVSTAVKLLVLPAVTIAALMLFGVSGMPAMVGLIFQSIATASSAYVMSRQLGGNAPLMAAIIAVQTIVSLALLPLVLSAGTLLLG